MSYLTAGSSCLSDTLVKGLIRKSFQKGFSSANTRGNMSAQNEAAAPKFLQMNIGRKRPFSSTVK